MRSTNIDFSKKTILHVTGSNETYVKAAMHFTSSKYSVKGRNFQNFLESLYKYLHAGLLPREDINFVATNWDSYEFFSLPYSRFFTTTRLGNIVGNFIQTLIDAGANPKKMHLIGFSTGGQVVGFAAKKIQPKVARITGEISMYLRI